ncbi:hypothetical protein JCM6882_005587 [Rhodosporidiobolus microsporus]
MLAAPPSSSPGEGADGAGVTSTTEEHEGTDGQFSDAEEEEPTATLDEAGSSVRRLKSNKLSTRPSAGNLAAVLATSSLSDLPPPVPPLPSPLPSVSVEVSPPLPALPPDASPRSPTRGEEVESLAVTTDSHPELVFPQRKSSLTPSNGSASDAGRPSIERRSSEDRPLFERRPSGDGSRRLSADAGRRPSADSGSGRRGSADAGRRPSTDGGSVRSNRSGHGSGHRVNPGAKHYFPLVQMPKKAKEPEPPVPAEAPPPPPASSPSDSAESSTPSSPPKRSNSISSARSPPRTAVFPTITPNRAAGAAIAPSVFPTVRRPSAAAAPRDETASVRSASTPSVASEAYPSPAPSSPARPFPTTAASSPARHTSPPASSYAPSIAPSSRTGRSGGGGYAPSIAPSHARSYAPSTQYAPSTTSSDGPVSIFLNPEAQRRPLTDLIPKKKLTSLFSRDKNKSAPSLGAPRTAPDGMTYRGKSASVLDAALATSQTWANRRGEQQRSFAGSAAFGPPAGYRPAHQMQRQREEAAAAGEGGGQPLSAEALAQALARGNDEPRRRPSIADSMMTVDSMAGPGGGGAGGGSSAFPVRQPVFATKPRPRPTEPDRQDPSTEMGLGIS